MSLPCLRQLYSFYNLTYQNLRDHQENVEFYGKVREGYLHLARNLPDRFFVVDGEGEPEEIEILIWNEIHSRFFNED